MNLLISQACAIPIAHPFRVIFIEGVPGFTPFGTNNAPDVTITCTQHPPRVCRDRNLLRPLIFVGTGIYSRPGDARGSNAIGKAGWEATRTRLTQNAYRVVSRGQEQTPVPTNPSASWLLRSGTRVPRPFPLVRKDLLPPEDDSEGHALIGQHLEALPACSKLQQDNLLRAL